MTSENVQSEQGAALLVVHADGTTDVYNVPPQSNVWIQGVKGGPSIVQVVTNDNASDAIAQVATVIGGYGAL